MKEELIFKIEKRSKTIEEPKFDKTNPFKIFEKFDTFDKNISFESEFLTIDQSELEEILDIRIKILKNQFLSNKEIITQITKDFLT